jgi:hypothetical protein
MTSKHHVASSFWICCGLRGLLGDSRWRWSISEWHHYPHFSSINISLCQHAILWHDYNHNNLEIIIVWKSAELHAIYSIVLACACSWWARCDSTAVDTFGTLSAAHPQCWAEPPRCLHPMPFSPSNERIFDALFARASTWEGLQGRSDVLWLDMDWQHGLGFSILR